MRKINGRIDWVLTGIPVLVILLLCILFAVFPERSNQVLTELRFFFGDTLGSLYLILGLMIFLVSVYLCVSRYGSIVLGDASAKPKYGMFSWGAMLFSCGLAADLLFYAPIEWILYASDPHMKELGDVMDWAGVFPLFHWSFIPWSFYLVLAVAFGFMLHVRKTKRKRFSESCRSVLGKYTDKGPGRFIDLFALFALLAGTATTFGLATPLMSEILKTVFFPSVDRKLITVLILILTCLLYTFFELRGIRGISCLANLCMIFFLILVGFVFLFGGETKFILENGFSSLGRMIQHFFELSTYTDPMRTTRFPQNWTVYYWAYWMVWCVAVPFFIGEISYGRTIRQVITGGFIFGVGSTLLGFLILGNFAMGKDLTTGTGFLEMYQGGEDLYRIILAIFRSVPCSTVLLLFLFLTMITFYATSFDSIARTAAGYSDRAVKQDEDPQKLLQILWCILLILFPIALVFSESTMNHLQSVSILAAFPIGGIIVLIVISFFKDAKQEL